MITSETTSVLATALCEAQGEFEGVEKSAANPFFKSHYADLASIIESVAPVLHKHGLSITQPVGWDGENDLLTTRLTHTSGEYMQSTMRLFLVKSDPQGQGSAITYARRYQLQAMLNLRTVDDDGNLASQPTQAPAKTTKRQPPKVVEPESVAPVADPETGEMADSNLATQKQLGFIAKLFKDKDFMDDHGVKLAYVNAVIARDTPVESAKDITKREAGLVIDSLQAESDPF